MIPLGSVYMRIATFESYYISKIIEMEDDVVKLWFSSYQGKSFVVDEEWINMKLSKKEIKFTGQIKGSVSLAITSDRTEYIFNPS